LRNTLIGLVRGAVERTFSQLKGRFGFTRMRYRGLVANAFHFDLAAVAFNLRTAAAKT
jgi:transposase, IS5 family